MNAWIKVGAVAVVGAAFFIFGYRYATALYEAEIAEMIADYERRSKSAQEDANAKLLAEREKNAKTTSELVAQIEDLSNRSRESAVRADRLQRELANRAKVSGAKSDTCGDCEERFARCSELLSEGVGLAQQGGELAERIAIRKDSAVRTIVDNQD